MASTTTRRRRTASRQINLDLVTHQLTLDVQDPEASGSDVVEEPSVSRFKVAVELSSMKKQLYAKHPVKVLLIDMRTGEVLAGAIGKIQDVAFPQFEKEGLEWTERVHKMKFHASLEGELGAP